jgi:acetyl esterase/lipase
VVLDLKAPKEHADKKSGQASSHQLVDLAHASIVRKVAGSPSVQRTRHRYGPQRAQTGDLWHPGLGGDMPVVMLIHGGFWRSIYTKKLMERLASAAVREGWAAWNIEYRRVGIFGGGGGWPETFEDVALALEFISTLEGCDRLRVALCGHSAGGTLALWGVANASTSSSTTTVQPRGVIALAPIADLERAAALSIGNGAVQRLLSGSPLEHPTRYEAASPVALLPFDAPQLIIHPSADTTIPVTLSERYAAQARASGCEVEFVSTIKSTHRQLIDPTSAGWPLIRGALSTWFDSSTM